jgi:hypothetical protein
MERKVFKPKNAKCGKCGSPIAYYKITKGAGKGKWCPCNPDGSDHWDDCRENLTVGRYGKTKIFNDNPDPRPTYHKNKSTRRKTLYSDPKIPPWDESLGEFKFLD